MSWACDEGESGMDRLGFKRGRGLVVAVATLVFGATADATTDCTEYDAFSEGSCEGNYIGTFDTLEGATYNEAKSVRELASGVCLTIV